MKCAIPTKKRRQKANSFTGPTSNISLPGMLSELPSEEQVDNFRQKIYSIIHCEKPVTSLYDQISSGRLNRVGPNYYSAANHSTLVASSASIHEKPRSKLHPSNNFLSPVKLPKPKITRKESENMLRMWQKHYSFYFPEFGQEDDNQSVNNKSAKRRERKQADSYNVDLFSTYSKSQGKCVVTKIPKPESIPKLNTSYFPTAEFTNSFPRTLSYQMKGKQGNSNSAEIKIDLSAKCRLNNDGKNVLKYRAYDGWEIAIPFTPSPVFGENGSISKQNNSKKPAENTSANTNILSKTDPEITNKETDNQIKICETYLPKMTCITPFGSTCYISKSAKKTFSEGSSLPIERVAQINSGS